METGHRKPEGHNLVIRRQVIGLSGDRNFVTHLQKLTESARKKITQITRVAGGGKTETMKVSGFRVYR